MYYVVASNNGRLFEIFMAFSECQNFNTKRAGKLKFHKFFLEVQNNSYIFTYTLFTLDSGIDEDPKFINFCVLRFCFNIVTHPNFLGPTSRPYVYYF